LKGHAERLGQRDALIPRDPQEFGPHLLGRHAGDADVAFPQSTRRRAVRLLPRSGDHATIAGGVRGMTTSSSGFNVRPPAGRRTRIPDFEELSAGLPHERYLLLIEIRIFTHSEVVSC